MNREVDNATVEGLLSLAKSQEAKEPEISDYQSLDAYQAEGGYEQFKNFAMA